MGLLFKGKKEGADAKKKAEMDAPARTGGRQALKGMGYEEGAAALQPQEAVAPSGGSMNPLKWGKEVQAFVDYASRVTDSGKKRVSQDDFSSLRKSFQSLNNLEKYSASSAMSRAGLTGLDHAIRGNDYGLTELDSM